MPNVSPSPEMSPPPIVPVESPVHIEAGRVMLHEKQEPQALLETNQLLLDTSKEYRFVYRLDDRGDALRVMKQQLDTGNLSAGQRKDLQQRYDLEQSLYQRDLKGWEAIEAASVTDNTPEGVGKKVNGLAVAEQFWTEQKIKAEQSGLPDSDVQKSVESFSDRAKSASDKRKQIRNEGVVDKKIREKAIDKVKNWPILRNFISKQEPVPGLTDEGTLQYYLHRDEAANQERWSSPYAGLSTDSLTREIQQAQAAGETDKCIQMQRQLELRQRGSETIDRLRVSLADQRAAIYGRKTEQDEARRIKTAAKETSAGAEKKPQTKEETSEIKPTSVESILQQISKQLESLKKPQGNESQLLWQTNEWKSLLQMLLQGVPSSERQVRADKLSTLLSLALLLGKLFTENSAQEQELVTA